MDMSVSSNQRRQYMPLAHGGHIIFRSGVWVSGLAHRCDMQALLRREGSRRELTRRGRRPCLSTSWKWDCARYVPDTRSRDHGIQQHGKRDASYHDFMVQLVY